MKSNYMYWTWVKQGKLLEKEIIKQSGMYFIFFKFRGSILMRNGLSVVSLCLCLSYCSVNEIYSYMIFHLQFILYITLFLVEWVLSLSLSLISTVICSFQLTNVRT